MIYETASARIQKIINIHKIKLWKKSIKTNRLHQLKKNRAKLAV